MTAPIAPQSSSLLEDLVDAFVAPATMFARRIGQGAFVPFVVVSLLLVVTYYANLNAMSGVIDAEVDKAVATAMERNPELTGEAIEKARGVIEMSVRYTGMAFLPVVLLGLALVTWIAMKLLGGEGGFGTALTIASFGYLPRVLEFAGVAIQSLLLDTSGFRARYSFSLGVGRFLDPLETPTLLYNVLGRVDVFTIWVTILLGIGLVRMAKVGRGEAVAGACAIWLLGALPAVLSAVGGQ